MYIKIQKYVRIYVNLTYKICGEKNLKKKNEFLILNSDTHTPCS
jgi:hypothetical protein